MNTLFQRPDRLHDPLHVVTTIFNPPRFRSRWKLEEDFERYVSCSGDVVFHPVEVAFGERDFSVTDPGNPNHLQLRTKHEMWYKENAINIGVTRLPLDWKYVAWVDADVIFARPDWANETIHQLQHYPIVQMFSGFQDLDSDHHPVSQIHKPFTTAFPAGEMNDVHYHYGKGASGLAWACRRDAWDQLGGLIDYFILGASDWYMAHALFGALDQTGIRTYHPHLQKLAYQWQWRAEKYIRRNIGVVPGLALHYWHGPKASRGYSTRERILVENRYSPLIDLKRDWQGLYQLEDLGTMRSIKLRDQIREYFRQRNEDMQSR